MGDAPARQERSVFGPWTGVNELAGELKDTDLEAAWNVELDGDLIRERGGRMRLVQASSSYPTLALLHDGADGWTDVTAVLTDGRTDTGAALSSLPTAGALYLCFGGPCLSISITVATPNSAAAAMAPQVSTPSGWHALSGAEFSDGTASAGASLAQSGALVIGAGLEDIPWAPGPLNEPDSIHLPAIYATRREFWVRLSFDAALDSSVVIAAVTGNPMFRLEGLLAEANGLFQWQPGTGERLLLLGLDNKATSVARLFVYDRNALALRPIGIPADMAKSGMDAFWTFTAVPNAVVACNGYTTLYLLAADPCTPRFFQAQEFLYPDAWQQQVPSQAQRFVTHFQARILFASGNRFVWSRAPSDVLNLKSIANAPLLGNSVFLASDYADVFDAAGGPITGLAQINSSLLIFTALATFLYDGLSLTCLDPQVGCIAPGSIAATDDAVYFLGVRGVYRYRGGVNELISRRIGPTLAGLNRAAAGRAVAALYHSRAQYRLFVPYGTNPRNNLGLIYDIERDAWTFFGVPRLINASPPTTHPYEVSAICSTRDGEWGEELLTVDYGGQVFLDDYGRLDEDKEILKLVVFGPLKWENPKVATLRYVRVSTGAAPKGQTLSVGLCRDDEPWERRVDAGARYGAAIEQTLALNDPGADHGGACNYADEGTWAASVWRAQRFVQKRASFGVTARAFQLMLSTTGEFAMRGLTYDVQPRVSERNEP